MPPRLTHSEAKKPSKAATANGQRTWPSLNPALAYFPLAPTTSGAVGKAAPDERRSRPDIAGRQAGSTRTPRPSKCRSKAHLRLAQRSPMSADQLTATTDTGIPLLAFDH